MIYLIDELDGIHNEGEGGSAEKKLLRLLPFLSDARKKKALSYHFYADSLGSAAVFVLLRYATLKEYHFAEMPVLFNSPTGKPYLRNRREIHFNFSHSKGVVACIIGDAERGIDVQERFAFDQGIVNHICSEKEKVLFEQVKDRDRLLNRLWVLKEAYTKYLGTGIIVDLKEIDFSDVVFKEDCKLEKTLPGTRQCFLKIVEKKAYCMATCSNQVEAGPIYVTIEKIEESLQELE